MLGAFTAKAPHVFLAKDARVFAYSKFENLMLTNEVISFKQLDPEPVHSSYSEQFYASSEQFYASHASVCKFMDTALQM